MAEEIYPIIHLDGKCFSGMGQMGDEVEVTLKGKIISTREDKFGICVGLEVYGVGAPGKDTKVVAPIVNEADQVYDKLAGVNPL